jgi:ankyrin repeat protein
MDAISHLEDGIEVQHTLHSLPTDLTDMYSNLLREHLQRTGIAPELHVLVLQCVTHAVRPLRLLEISDCITVTQPQHGKDSGKLKKLVRSACGPLLEILPDETVRVVHHSLTEYLLGTIRPVNDTLAPFVALESGQTHERIAMLCLKYLHLGALAQLKVKTSGFQGEAIETAINTPFTNYALTNWHTHIKNAAAFGHDLNSVNDYLHQLLVEGHKDNTKKLSLSANLQSNGGRSSGRSPKTQAVALRLAIALDLHSFVESLLDRYGTDITNYDPDIDYSPLIFAVTTGNCDIVQSLIRNGADVNEYDTHGATPLHTAVGWGFGRKGNAVMAEILLRAGAHPEKDLGKNQHVDDCSFGGREKYPACRYAFQGADKDTAAVFMPYINGTQEASRALNWAIGAHSARDPGVIDEILCHPDLDLNTRHSIVGGNFKMTPLFLACRARDSSLIQKLLNAGADPNVPHISTGQDGLFSSRKSAEVDSSGHNVLHALANRGGDHLFGTLADVGEEETRECFKLVIAAGANCMYLLILYPFYILLSPSGYSPTVAIRQLPSFFHLTI